MELVARFKKMRCFWLKGEKSFPTSHDSTHCIGPVSYRYDCSSVVQFRLERYMADIHPLQQMNQDSFIAMLKRYSTGFARYPPPFCLDVP